MLLLQQGHADNILKVTGRHSKTMTFLIYHFDTELWHLEKIKRLDGGIPHIRSGQIL